MLNRSLAVHAAISLGALLTFGPSVVAQSEEDAMRYLFIVPGGTARSWALGSAVGAVGADPGSATVNPAGFGLYNTSEVSLTPSFEVNDAQATYYGTKSADTDQRFHFNNLALILHYPGKRDAKVRGFTIGISYDRQATYHWNEQAIGKNVNSTMLDRFRNEADGTSYDQLEGFFPFTSNLAWNTYGIDTVPGTLDQYATPLPEDAVVEQQHTIGTSGKLNNTSFFFALNHTDKFYFGGTIGIVGVKYERHTSHREINPTQGADFIKEFTYTEDLLTTGGGIDLKVGAIARLSPQVRIGASFHSPMWLALSDVYSYNMTTTFHAGDSHADLSPDGTFDYRVRTPYRATGSLAYIIGKHGLLSIDYGYTASTSSKLSPVDDSYEDYFVPANQNIRDLFQPTHSLRAGTEWRSGHWYFRGGYGIWPEAYKDKDLRHGTSYRRISGGVGFRSTRVSVDLAVVHGTRDTKFFQYDAALVNPTNERLTDVRTMLTVAFRP
jgi:hypothetical protein